MTFVIHNLKYTAKKINLLNKNYFHLKWLTSRSYNVLFFGSDNIALKSFQKVNEFRKKEKIIKRLDLVVTVNALKKGSEIEKYAQEEKIRTVPWPLVNVNKGEYDLGLIVAFGHLIKDDVLEKFPLGMVNVHPSLLPRWRGAAPIIHTLLHGDKVTGVSLMKIKANVFDVGEIIEQRKVAVPKDIKLPELTDQLSEIGADMLVNCLRSLPTSLEKALPQRNEGVTYAKKINKNISRVSWSDMSAKEVYNLYRAIYGIYPLTTTFRDKPMKLFNAFLQDMEEMAQYHVPKGTLEYCDKNNALRVVCKDRRYIYFKSLRILGKKEISAIDFYNGYIKNVPIDKRKYVVC
ncbi:methionyl-tRNA formyltransferase, mitochondrial [Epargyreus clarus]|uniref:methionyl-tRNA formyltransferase, mitochondrial n=1 Tax=Epargyreus clarus TaxID=520877 RepID=UPI003C3031AD